MGIYVFTARFLFEQLCLDATRPGSRHDFGRNIIPSIIDTHRVFAFPFRDENRKRDAYWRDVGTLDAYYEANMDLIARRSAAEHVRRRTGRSARTSPTSRRRSSCSPSRAPKPAAARRSTASSARDRSSRGGQVERSILGPNVRVNSYAHVEDSILFEGVDIGRHARVRRAIIDKGVRIPPGTSIGYDPEQDRARGFTVSEGGHHRDRQSRRRRAF